MDRNELLIPAAAYPAVGDGPGDNDGAAWAGTTDTTMTGATRRWAGPVPAPRTDPTPPQAGQAAVRGGFGGYRPVRAADLGAVPVLHGDHPGEVRIIERPAVENLPVHARHRRVLLHRQEVPRPGLLDVRVHPGHSRLSVTP